MCRPYISIYPRPKSMSPRPGRRGKPSLACRACGHEPPAPLLVLSAVAMVRQPPVIGIDIPFVRLSPTHGHTLSPTTAIIPENYRNQRSPSWLSVDGVGGVSLVFSYFLCVLVRWVRLTITLHKTIRTYCNKKRNIHNIRTWERGFTLETQDDLSPPLLYRYKGILALAVSN